MNLNLIFVRSLYLSTFITVGPDFDQLSIENHTLRSQRVLERILLPEEDLK